MAAADRWVDAGELSDEQLAEQIRNDQIDILFDLGGHLGGNRLLVFARKPAPIQVKWVGYPGSAGLTAMDYLLADRWQVEAGGEAYCPEKVLRLPDGYVCFDPPADAPEVGPLPAMALGEGNPKLQIRNPKQISNLKFKIQNGPQWERGAALTPCPSPEDGRGEPVVTFGSFNNPAKITPCVVAAWAEILRRTPGSRLVLKYQGFDQPGTRRRYEGLFAAGGVGPERLELPGWSPRGRMLADYNRVDLALDPFPYSGGVTTCEALWMGVPVITLPGRDLCRPPFAEPFVERGPDRDRGPGRGGLRGVGRAACARPAAAGEMAGGVARASRPLALVRRAALRGEPDDRRCARSGKSGSLRDPCAVTTASSWTPSGSSGW